MIEQDDIELARARVCESFVSVVAYRNGKTIIFEASFDHPGHKRVILDV